MKNIFFVTFLSILIGFTHEIFAASTSLHILAPMQVLDPVLIKQFEKENACTVKVDFIVDNSGYETQLRSDLKIFDLVIADEKSLVQLTTENLLRTLPKQIQQPRSPVTPFQIKTSFNEELNTYIPLFVNPLGIAYKPSISNVDTQITWNDLFNTEKNPYWRQHVYIPNNYLLQIALAILATNEPIYSPKRLPIPVQVWLKKLKAQEALLSEPLIFTLGADAVNAAIISYRDFLNYNRYLEDLDFIIPNDGTYFERLGIAWCLSSIQTDLAVKFIQFIDKNSYKFAEFNKLFDVQYNLNTDNAERKRFYKSTSSYKKDFNIHRWRIYNESSFRQFLSSKN